MSITHHRLTSPYERGCPLPPAKASPTPVDGCDVLDAMEVYGGGFVSALAKAWRRADMDNTRRLREAFPHYWEQYEAVARQCKARTEWSAPCP